MTRRWRLLATLLATLGCTAALRPEQARVRVTTDREASKGCKLVGNVEGDSNWEDEAFHEVQRHAAKLGADTVVLTFQSPNGKRKRGEAFRCDEIPEAGRP